MSQEAVEQFINTLYHVIDGYRDMEEDNGLTYCEMIGALDIVKTGITEECLNTEGQEC